MSEPTVEQTAWDAIPLEKVADGMHRRIVTGERMTVARIYFEDGFHVPQQSNHVLSITDRTGRELILATQNDAEVRVFEPARNETAEAENR